MTLTYSIKYPFPYRKTGIFQRPYGISKMINENMLQVTLKEDEQDENAKKQISEDVMVSLKPKPR